MKRLFPHVCAALFALMVLCSVTTRAADNVYAILYDDGTLGGAVRFRLPPAVRRRDGGVTLCGKLSAGVLTQGRKVYMM